METSSLSYHILDETVTAVLKCPLRRGVSTAFKRHTRFFGTPCAVWP